jgi:8-oxo-dGTP diphosphatase
MSVETILPKQNINIWIDHLKKDAVASVSVDCVILGYINGDLHIAVLECNMPPFLGQDSLVGDLLTSEETLDEAASRIVQERTGLSDIFLEQVQTFSNIDRHPLGRVITVAYYSLIKLYDVTNDSASAISNVKWVKVKDAKTMAFDHKLILDSCLQRLREKAKFNSIGFNLLPRKFTLNELQELYEAVLGHGLDKRNFRRKLESLNILIDLNEAQKDVSHRPAKLYSFNIENYDKSNMGV